MNINFRGISHNLKKAIEEEVLNLLDEETKYIQLENKRLQEENIRLVRIVKRYNEDKLKGVSL